MRSLIADDSPGFRSLLQLILAPFGHCGLAEDGEECVRLFEDAHKRNEPYDLVCLDLNMPKLNGIDTLKVIRNTERSWNIPDERKVNILMITSSTAREHIIEAHALNCQGYILKPFKKSKVVEKLGQLNLLDRGTPQPPPPTPVEVKPDSSKSNTSAPATRLQIFVRPSSPELGLMELPPGDGKPNYFKLLTAFDNVRKGHPIAIPIDHPDASLVGLGVEFDQRKNLYRAGIDGRLEIGDDNTLSIKDLIIIHGDVDSTTGNIDFIGRVGIRGDVKNSVSVKGGKGIRVSGSVGASTLESEGDITVDSIRSQARGLIKCGGTFRARSISHISIETLGDVLVATEILSSQVKSRGAISIPDGQIAGGSCIALKGIEASKIGTEKHILTKVMAGVDYVTLDCVRLLKTQFAAIVQRLEEIDRTLAPFAAALPPDSEPFLQLPERRRNQILSILEEKNKLEEQKPQIETQFEAINHEFGDEANPKINVRQKLFAGTVAEIGATSKNFTEDLAGPISLTEGSDGNELLPLPLSPLDARMART